MRFGKVALASYPRSGNTWFRHLIHAATGIGSIYNVSRETGIEHHAGGIQHIEEEGSPFIKTHGREAQRYEAAVHLIRNPKNAIASYIDYFEAFSDPVSRREEFIAVESESWVRHSEYWRMSTSCTDLSFGYELVRYEDLCDSTARILKRVLNDFLGMDVAHEAIAGAAFKCQLERLQVIGDKKFFPKGKSRDFRDSLTSREIEIIDQLTWKEAQNWGYQ